MAKTLDEETARPPKGPVPLGPEAEEDAPLLDDADSAPKGLARRSSSRETKTRRWPLVLLVVLLVAVSLVQAAGLIFRDQLQGRQTSSSIEEVFAHMAEVVPVSAEARRSALGFGVTQVVVGGGPAEGETASGAQPPAPPPPVAHGEEAAPKQVAPREAAAPKEAAAARESEPKQEAVAEAPAPPGGVRKKGSDPYALKPSGQQAKALPAEPTPKPAPAKSEPEKAEAKKLAGTPAAKETTAPPPKGKAAGAYAVSVGIFRSQKFVFEAEEKLRELKLPSYRRESKKNGEGIRVRVTAGDAARKKAAAEALRGVGYSLSESAGGLDVYVLYKEEADQVAQIARSAGAEAKAESVKGALPVWKVFAGPMDRQEADKAAARIKAAGMECFVTRNEP